MTGKATFNWQDPLLLDQQLSEEERMVRDSAQQFAEAKLAPRVLQAFRHEQTDPLIFREMGETGLLGATIPEAYGGSFESYLKLGLGIPAGVYAALHRDSLIDRGTGTVSTRAVVPNPDQALLPGQFVRVLVKGITKPNAMTVPERSVSQGPSGTCV